jgi:hypothetical protein
MTDYVDCKNAQSAVAKVVTELKTVSGLKKDVYYFSDYESAEKVYEDGIGWGFSDITLYFRGVRNKWIEMVAE